MRSCSPWSSVSCRHFFVTKIHFCKSLVVLCCVGLFYSCVIVCICFFELDLYSHLSIRKPLGGGQGWKCCNTYFMPLRSTWLAAMSMTLMMKAMAKAHIRLLRTQVCLTCCVGLEPVEDKKKRWVGKEKRLPGDLLSQVLLNAWKIPNHFWMKELITKPYIYMNTIIRDEQYQ